MGTHEAKNSSLNGAKEEDWELVSGSKSLPVVEDKPVDSPVKDPEDWYKTIPATPANTPEYNPLPPPYPQGPPEVDLEPIEEVSEEQNTNIADINDKPDAKTPTNADGSTPKEKDQPYSETLGLATSGLARLVLYSALLYIVKQTVVKFWQLFRGPSQIPATETSD